MQIISDFFIGILTAYLAFSNSLATEMRTWFVPDTTPLPITIEQEESDSGLFSLPSKIGSSIPDILLKSAEYQKASVVDAVKENGVGVENPVDSIVNIYCTLTTNEYIRTTTGTGFFIDQDGIIMTNAHVAQFLLLEDTTEFGDTECIVRSGNPAAPKYIAELLYLPPAWVQENASVMSDSVPMGTGERDYSLLYVSQSIDNTPLPARFPYLDFDTSLIPTSIKNKAVTAAGYPARNLLTNGPDVDLIPREASTTVSELYTFGSNYADIFSIRGSKVGEEGSSGGPVVNSEGEAIGVIVTRGNDEIDGEGSLRAITISHIDRTITEETGFSLVQNMQGNLPHRAQVYEETLTPFLVTILKWNQTN